MAAFAEQPQQPAMSPPGSARVMSAPAAPTSARGSWKEDWDDFHDSDSAADLEYPSTTSLSTKPKAPQFSFGTRPKALANPDVPGPGSYYEVDLCRLARYNKTPNFSFGSGTRQDARRPRVPGPGAYTQKPLLGKAGVSFSCTPRRGEPQTRAKIPPGPGAHDVPGYIGKTGPRHTMTPRRKHRDVFEVPAAPGPGDYSHVDGSTKGAPPRWGFGSSSQRPKELIERVDPTPGPGAYRQESPRTGPQFSMRARTAVPKQRLAKF